MNTVNEAHVVQLFVRMAHLFGHKWTSVYGAAMKDGKPSLAVRQWMHDLQDFAPEQLLTGLAEIERRAPEWPPGVMDFKAMCQGVPTVGMVLDRDTDHGPVCREIRRRLDWYNLDGMPAKDKLRIAQHQVETAISNLRGSGKLAQLALSHAGSFAITDNGSEHDQERGASANRHGIQQR